MINNKENEIGNKHNKDSNEINKEPISEIRFKLKGAIDSGQKKAYLLLQSALSGN